ncbi:hypothetical protein [Neobacillus sp. LXY-4]|uniref:hypothetical protein n=1 Tax=Neobacillus sp. LXY-4 TaxID=3379826 RepID=UPI003EE0DEFF
MEANYEKLYSELRKTKEELLAGMNNSEGSPVVQSFINEEIDDIDTALSKMMTGTYGKCEISGELIPYEVLEVIPTIKTINEMEVLGYFFRKPILMN